MIQFTEIRPTRKLPGFSSIIVTFNYDPQYVDIMHSLDSAVYDKKSQTWEIPTTSLSKALDLFCEYDDIELNLCEDEPVTPDKQFELQQYKTNPFAYQGEGIQYGLNHNKFLLLDAPGLGKTLQILYLAQELKQRENIEHCLIICGLNTLKTNWKREVFKHTNLSCRILGERTTKRGKVKFGGIKERLEDLKSPLDEFFVIVNIETLRNDDVVKLINKGPNKFDMIAFDEIHQAKNPTSAQGSNLLKLKNAKYKVGMTGTLLLNSPLDAFVPLHFIEADNSTYTNFKYYYCSYGGPFNNILQGFKNTKVLKDQLEKVSLRRTKDLLDLPEKTVINEYLDMETEQDKFYNNIKQGIIDQVDKVEITTSSLLAMVARLRQATACPSILTTEQIPSIKIDRTCELVEEIVGNGSKVVVFSTFKETTRQLYERLQEYNPLLCTGDVDDNTITNRVNEFQNNPNSKVFIATWQKMGTGITLTAANYAIFLDTPWTAGVYEQAQDRIHRIGSKDPVFIYNLIVNNTIDERVLELVNDKAAISDYMIDNQISVKALDSLKKYLLEDL